MTHAALPRRPGSVTSKSHIILAAIVAAAALAVGMAQTSTGHSLLRETGLYEEPASYTSLAFTDPQSLPTRLSPAPSSARMSFAISNASADPRSYHWSIVLERTGHTYRLAAGEVRVPAEGRVTVARTVTAWCRTGQARMTVQVAAPAESIDFWVACSSRKGGRK
jgi:hypothetical protein